MKTLPFDAIIFDLDGTLRESQPQFMDVLHEVLRTQGIEVPRPSWRDIERWVYYYWARSPEIQEDVQKYGEEKLWARFLYRLLKKTGHSVTEEEITHIEDLFAENYHPTSTLMPGAKEILETLRSYPVVLGVLSNRHKSFEDELNALGIREYFDFLLAAGEIGVWKPHPQIFLAALERAGNISPRRAVYIGDNYFADVKGAQNVGMHAILIDNKGLFPTAKVPTVRSLHDALPLLLYPDRTTPTEE